ncbi:hypothetical protein QYE76_005746 [Lolium multiflorum]|uniref:Alpha/beta hydrolase fold-3 domain-containing protein n=1 Tax=Lolium multiflorum TaxID=4521 RepID=A0AAD8RTB2_LOLMU|nr:hypothetical protein QYE76_005746 [Lolium multiflorum]
MWARSWNGSDDGSLLLKVDELLLDAADGGLQLELLHTGAFMIHTAASPIYHKYAASLAAAAPAIVVSVDYRLAPEHRVPAAYEDAFAALKAVVSSCRPDGARRRVPRSPGGRQRRRQHGAPAAARLRKERVEGYGDEVSGVALLHSYFWGKEPTEGAIRGGIDRVWEVACGGELGLDHPYINPAPEERRRLGCRRVLVATAELCWFVERSRAYAEGMSACGWEGELEFHETRATGMSTSCSSPTATITLKICLPLNLHATRGRSPAAGRCHLPPRPVLLAATGRPAGQSPGGDGGGGGFVHRAVEAPLGASTYVSGGSGSELARECGGVDVSTVVERLPARWIALLAVDLRIAGGRGP